MSQGRPGRETSLPNLGIPSIEDESILKPRPRQVTEPFFFDNQANDFLSPPINEHTVSESGRSYLTFASLDSVYDRGTANYAAWENTLGISYPAASPPNIEHRKILGSSPITRQSLDDALWGQAKRSKVGTERFLPLDRLKALINPTTVKELLESTPLPREDVKYLLKGIFGDEQVQTFHCRAKAKSRRRWPGLFRTFALLIMVDQVSAIRQFVDHGLDDSLLPIFVPTEEEEAATGHTMARSPISRADNTIDNRKLQQCFASFTYPQLLHFCYFQKLVNVPFFLFPAEDFNVSFYELDPECVLPFIDVGQPKTGAYGSVKKIIIHPAHHNYSRPNNENPLPAFAVKTLLVQNEEKFKKEVEASEILLNKRHHKLPDHLVHLELAYRHGEQCCLVFPWADGNLKEYWESHPRGYRSPMNHNDVLWVFKQCSGLALGLRRLHHPSSFAMKGSAGNGDIWTAEDILDEDKKSKYGRHGDIKPENILWFKNYNDDLDHLAICDFGSTEFNSVYSKSHVDARGITGYSETYQPPDTRLELEVGQKIDVWSLGCVFLEFVSWFLLGYHETVHEFPRRRMRPQPQHPENIIMEDRFFAWEANEDSERGQTAIVNPAVVEWIRKIHSLDTCPKSIHEFLDLIQEQMLQPKASNRSDCKMVRVELHALYKKCQRNKIYATEGYSKTQNHTKDLVRQLQNLPGLNEHHQSLDERHPVLFPGLSDEMRDQASLTAPRSQEIQVDKEPPSQSEEPFQRSRRSGNATTSGASVLLSQDTTKSSYGLSRMVTNDTTPCTTQLDATDSAPLQNNIKQSRELCNEDDCLKDEVVAFNDVSWAEGSLHRTTSNKASSIPKDEPDVEGRIEIPTDQTVAVQPEGELAKSSPGTASLPQVKSATPKVHTFQGVQAILHKVGRTFGDSDRRRRGWKFLLTQKWKRRSQRDVN